MFRTECGSRPAGRQALVGLEDRGVGRMSSTRAHNSPRGAGTDDHDIVVLVSSIASVPIVTSGSREPATPREDRTRDRRGSERMRQSRAEGLKRRDP